MITLLKLMAVVALLALGGPGCMTRPKRAGSHAFAGAQMPYVRTLIITRYEPGVAREEHEVPFPEYIAEWERLFPSYPNAKGNRGAGFFSSYRLIFMRPDGTASWVAATKDEWTNGRGNFPVNGDIDALYARTTNYLHYIEENWPRGEIQEDGSIRVNFRAELMEDGTFRRLDPPVTHKPEPSAAP